jgi:hypothetical protein
MLSQMTDVTSVAQRVSVFEQRLGDGFDLSPVILDQCICSLVAPTTLKQC